MLFYFPRALGAILNLQTNCKSKFSGEFIYTQFVKEKMKQCKHQKFI